MDKGIEFKVCWKIVFLVPVGSYVNEIMAENTELIVLLENKQTWKTRLHFVKHLINLGS